MVWTNGGHPPQAWVVVASPLLSSLHSAGRHQQALSPYEAHELRLAVEGYDAKKRQAVDLFAQIRALRARRQVRALHGSLRWGVGSVCFV